MFGKSKKIWYNIRCDNNIGEIGMLKLDKKAKIISAALIFCIISGAGFAVEHIEKDAFIMETVATEDVISYQSDSESIINGKININSADVTELKQLDGIGEALAGRIIGYREENGKFETIEEIMKVSGINEKKFAVFKNDICAE